MMVSWWRRTRTCLLALAMASAVGCGSSDSDPGGSPGVGGSGGTTTGDGGPGGSSGTGGTGGSGGTGIAGAAGTGGTGVAGEAGSAGTGGTGVAGEAGAAGEAGSAGTGGSPSCTDKCTEGISQCVGVQVQVCEVQASGCTDWSEPEACPGDKACNAGECPTCTDNCTYGNTQCSGSQVVICEVQADGCFDWSAPQDCPDGEACTNNQCPTCVDSCTLGETQCAGAQVQVCETQSDGCAGWSAPENCDGGKACIGDACPTCTDDCSVNETQCAGAQEQACEMQADGCFHWGTAYDCADGKSCIGDACPICTDKCVLDDTKCFGTQVQTCEMQSDGCTDWSTAADCPNAGVCQNNECVGSCTVGELRCNGNLLEVCNGSQAWQTQQVCAQACDPQTLACETDVTCTPAARRCNGNQVQVCNSTGTAWLTTQTCAVTCSQGLCTGACTPGERRCNGNTPEECNATGTAWDQDPVCSTFCYQGNCAEPTLTIDADANAELDGEHVIDGDVVIKSSSQLTVPSGRLVIRAKNVLLDATSSITVAPNGTDSRGAGTSGGSTSCAASGCTAYGTVGGGGGGFGTTGASASQTLTCYYYGYARTCTATFGGGAKYGIADDEAVWGAQGGACSSTPGGKGGGLLAIYAETITIAGTITADGQSGSGCSGGGSGGAIVLRATNTLTFSGAASVAGGQGGSNGAGSGATGVIKLLWGNSHTIGGSTTGTVYSSYMPPWDLSSSTHPNPDRWYNDGFPAFEMAWSRPFTQSGGYYYVLNTTYGFVPSPSNAQYQDVETHIYQPADVMTGVNYFHTSVVGPSFDISTIEGRFRIQVNATPPTISSSSHASQTTWYDNDNAFLTWTLPKADENTTKFYWVLDRFYDTLPDKSANQIPMNLSDPASSKRILLPMSGDGIWFFHLITEDTMGYLTKQGARFRLQIGTDPGKGGVSGTVTDSTSGGFVDGVEISLNRGIHTASTNSSGAYAFTNNTVFAQEYEIRARKDGYVDNVKTVVVEAGQTATVNFALVPE